MITGAYRWCGVVLAAALVLTACTGDDGASEGTGPDVEVGSDAGAVDDERYAAALAANLGGAPGSPITPDQAGCVAPAMIDLLGGPDAIERAGLGPDDLAVADPGVLATTGLAVDPAEAGSLGAVAIDCGVDLVGAIADTMGDDLAASARTCLEGEFDADVVGRLLLDDPTATVRDAVLACAHHLD